MESTMLVQRGNSYKISHINKANLWRKGYLPSSSQEAIDKARSYINEILFNSSRYLSKIVNVYHKFGQK